MASKYPLSKLKELGLNSQDEAMKACMCKQGGCNLVLTEECTKMETDRQSAMNSCETLYDQVPDSAMPASEKKLLIAECNCQRLGKNVNITYTYDTKTKSCIKAGSDDASSSTAANNPKSSTLTGSLSSAETDQTNEDEEAKTEEEKAAAKAAGGAAGTGASLAGLSATNSKQNAKKEKAKRNFKMGNMEGGDFKGIREKSGSLSNMQLKAFNANDFTQNKTKEELKQQILTPAVNILDEIKKVYTEKTKSNAFMAFNEGVKKSSKKDSKKEKKKHKR
jgi:hypothetical protein